jgi:hypothetical protein
MARTRKRPRPAARPAPRADLSDWQGFRTRRHSSRYRVLVAAALLAAVTTLVLSQVRARLPGIVFNLWIFSLLAAQVWVVVESERLLRDALRRAVRVASAFGMAAFAGFALGASPIAAFALAAALLAVAFLPPAWHAWLVDVGVGGA